MIDPSTKPFIHIPSDPDCQIPGSPGTTFEKEDYQENRNLLSRHVKWHRQERSGMCALGQKLLLITEVALACLSVIGVFFLVKAVKEARLQKTVEKFFKKAENKTPPEIEEPISIKRPTQGYNHVTDYVIKDDIIWYCSREEAKTNPDAPWSPMYFDGMAEGRKPVSLSVDGCNLLVIDDENKAHYRKILNENRTGSAEEGNRKYIYMDKSQRNNWNDAFFNLPILSKIINLFIEKKLKLPEGTHVMAVSHRGRFSDHYDEARLRKRSSEIKSHHTTVGCSSAFTLLKDKRTLRIYDPWKPPYVEVLTNLPESSNSSFEAENIDVAASTVGAVGWETKYNPEDDTYSQEFCFYTRFCDLDYWGWNPLIANYYTYDPKETDNKKRLIWGDPWQKQPLPELQGQARLSTKISMHQTGEGNATRELRIEGRNADGDPGYYYKLINDDKWQFEPNKQCCQDINEENLIAPNQLQNPAVASDFSTRAANYEGKVTFKGKSNDISARIKDFNPLETFSTIQVDVGGEEISLPLLKQGNLIEKIITGTKRSYYKLVLAQEEENKDIKHLFGGNTVIDVEVKEKDNQLHIYPRGLKITHKFSFTLQKRC